MEKLERCKARVADLRAQLERAEDQLEQAYWDLAPEDRRFHKGPGSYCCAQCEEG